VFFKKDKKQYVNDIKYFWYKKIGMNCDLYPVYFPKQLFLRSLSGKILTYLSYRNIQKRKFKTIYVGLDFMDYFAKKFLPKINHKFILVTGDSDNSTSQFKEVLDNPYLVHWFAQNDDLKNKKITAIPIGVDYHTIFTADFFGEKRKSPVEQEKELIAIKDKPSKKQLKVFANFHLNLTSPRRAELYDSLRNSEPFYFQPIKMPRTKMWAVQSQYAFSFSPVGAGIDCLRTWEALILGQIPIVERTNTPIDDLYKQYPIVLIDDVKEITQENLQKWYKRYAKSFNKELDYKLTNAYWINKINVLKSKIN
jgi:hypothetical protein